MKFIDQRQYKANLHCHSVLSDGHMDPKALKDAYRAHGYSILAITDHERPYDHSDMSEKDFLMLTGYEAYIRPRSDAICDKYRPEVHLNLFAKDAHNVDLICPNEAYIKYVTDENERAKIKRFGSEETRRYDVDYINMFIRTAISDGYLVAYNHAVWSGEDFARISQYQGIFSMEICNFASYNGGHPEYNAALYDLMLASGRRIFAHSADDNHDGVPIGKPGNDSFGGFTMINTPDGELSYGGVIKALENGSFYSSMGPIIHELEICGDTAYIKTSEAAQITMLFGSKQTKRVRPEEFGQHVCEGEFIIPPEAQFVRFNVRDDFGRFADTRGYFKSEYTE